MERRPYRQGHLDGFCGVYSVVNSMRLINRRMGDEKATMLFKRILRCLERKRTLSCIATEGLSLRDLEYIINKVVIRQYGITVTRPFCRVRMPSTDYFLDEVSAYLKEYPRRAVICSVDGHWSVLKQVTAKLVHFYDSAWIKKVHRQKCSVTNVSSRRPYYFDKKDVFFLER